MSLPAPLAPIMLLASELRQHGFPIAVDQTNTFIEAIEILGPESIHDIRHAALAAYSITPERMSEFDLVFNSIFYGVTVAGKAENDEETVDAQELAAGSQEIEVYENDDNPGADAADTENLNYREFHVSSDDRSLRQFEQRASASLPLRKSYRWKQSKKGVRLSMRHTLRQSVKHDGEMVKLSFAKRKHRQRKVLLLIDVSNSMKERSESALVFAHALQRVALNAEVFTLGTRLTRLTPSLEVQNRELALSRASQIISDVDGGTRLGSTLQLFLHVPKYMNMARGAAVVVLSDGLERGDTGEFTNAVYRLSQLAWQLSWLSPLAMDADYSVETEALKSVLPFLDHFEPGHSIEALCDHVLNLASAA